MEVIDLFRKDAALNYMWTTGADLGFEEGGAHPQN